MGSLRGAVAGRVPETDEGLQGDDIAVKYDAMQRHIRDNGWLQEKVDDVAAARITSGTVLEVGCGPGYLGLEWAVQIAPTARLVGVDISDAMVRRARDNARAYGIAERCAHLCADVLALPHPDASFDHVFSASSLHEWSDPVAGLREIGRVLRPGGRYCVIDLRRDVDRITLQFMKANIEADMRPGFLTSIRSSYLRSEVVPILASAGFAAATVSEAQMGLVIAGRKDTP